jgi:hypothetical protein
VNPACSLRVAMLSFFLLSGTDGAWAERSEVRVPSAEEDHFDALFDVVPAGGAQFIGVGSRGGADASRCWVIRLSTPDRVVWDKTPCSAPGVVLRSLTRLSDGDFAAVGYLQQGASEYSNAFAIRFDGEGRVAWQRPYPTSRHERLYFVEELDDGRLLVGGRSADDASSTAPTQGLILLLSPKNGKQSARFTFSHKDAARAAFLDGVQVDDGSLVLAGWATDEATREDDLWVLKVDLRGRELWNRRFGGAGDDLAHKILALPGSKVAAFGWMTPKGSRDARGLFLELDATGAVLAERLYEVGSGGNDRFRSAVLEDGGRFLVAGQATASARAPNRGWLLALDAQGNALREDVFANSSPGRLYGIARADSGAVLGVGWSLPLANRKADGWVVGMAAVEPAAGAPQTGENVVLDSLGAASCGEIPADRMSADCPFSLRSSAWVRVSVLPSGADVDVVLAGASGTAIEMSNNGGLAAELIERELTPGDYVARVSKFREGGYVSRFRLRVTTGDGAAGARESEEWDWSASDGEMIAHALRLVGYDLGPPGGLSGASGRRAIKALQAALEEEPTGALTPGQRLHLAVFAALQAERKAQEAVAVTRRVLSESRLTRREPANVFGIAGELETTGLDGVYYGEFRGKDGRSYVGTWEDMIVPTDAGDGKVTWEIGLLPRGYGSLVKPGDPEQAWSGEFSDDRFIGVLAVDGMRHDIGEWGQGRTTRYGIERRGSAWVLRDTASPLDNVGLKSRLFGEL